SSRPCCPDGNRGRFPDMPSIVWIDGTWYDRGSAVVSVWDHGLLYGDGVFEGIRAYGGRVFRLAAHLDRLYASATAIWLAIPLTTDRTPSPKSKSSPPGGMR